MNIKDRRAFKRFDVLDFSPIQMKLVDPKLDCLLGVLASGGCGLFEENPKSEETRLRQRFYFEFYWDGVTEKAIEIQGTLVYCRPTLLRKNKVRYYGIQFLEAHQDRLKPIIGNLDILENQGKVALA